jgi:hypothetical protein
MLPCIHRQAHDFIRYQRLHMRCWSVRLEQEPGKSIQSIFWPPVAVKLARARWKSGQTGPERQFFRKWEYRSSASSAGGMTYPCKFASLNDDVIDDDRNHCRAGIVPRVTA